jgi:circadian clock protein KaiB
MPKKEEQKPNGVDSSAAKEAGYVLRLFVTGTSPNSIRAINNLKQICEKYLHDNYSLEIIDVYQQVAVAQTEQLIALPMLIRKQPLPERRLIGDLSQTEKVLKGLGLLF